MSNFKTKKCIQQFFVKLLDYLVRFGFFVGPKMADVEKKPWTIYKWVILSKSSLF